MIPVLAMTTSWDDGHPLDLRVAELLAKHGLSGTFYIPLEIRDPVMSRRQVNELVREFEVGAHTVHHVELPTVSDFVAAAEIRDSKRRLEEITGIQCDTFCFPKGRFQRKHLEMVRESGFRGVRTVELLSLEKPLNVQGIALIPTTVQAYSHGLSAYVRNSLRRRGRNLFHVFKAGRHKSWESVANRLLERACSKGGVFHLWGHSWEIDRFGQWKALDRVLHLMSQMRKRAACMTNKDICRYAS